MNVVALALFIWVNLIATAFYINITSHQCFDSDATAHALDATANWEHLVLGAASVSRIDGSKNNQCGAVTAWADYTGARLSSVPVPPVECRALFTAPIQFRMEC